MAKGVVVRIERSNGYGFIEMEDGRSAFFHQRWLKGMRFRDIKIGSIVEFDLDQGTRGLKAVNMRFASDD